MLAYTSLFLACKSQMLACNLLGKNSGLDSITLKGQELGLEYWKLSEPLFSMQSTQGSRSRPNWSTQCTFAEATSLAPRHPPAPTRTVKVMDIFYSPPPDRTLFEQKC